MKLLFSIALVLAAGGAVTLDPATPRTLAVAQGGGRDIARLPECPHSWDSLATVLRNDSAALGLRWSNPSQPGQTAAAGIYTNVSEFHDCQRLITRPVGGTRQYRTLGALFASVAALRRYAYGPRFDSASALSPRHILIGEVLADSEYRPLGLRRGFNCLVAVRDVGGYRPYMVPVRWDEAACGQNLTGRPARALEMRVAGPPTGPTWRADDVPPVGRWETDAVDRPFIGLKCGKAWCEIGTPSEFGASLVYAASPSIPPEIARTTAIQGYYDEQWLAHPGVPYLTPGPTRGTVFPTPELGRWNDAEFLTVDGTGSKWLHVASVSLSDNDDTYAGKFGWQKSLAPVSWVSAPQVNELRICREVSARARAVRCKVPAGAVAAASYAGCKTGWYGMSTVNGGLSGPTRKVYCVKNLQHGITPPNVVRWRWQPNDETVWIACPKGCCEIKLN